MLSFRRVSIGSIGSIEFSSEQNPVSSDQAESVHSSRTVVVHFAGSYLNGQRRRQKRPAVHSYN